MIYVIMCGGQYEQFETPRHMSIVNGERIVERTIRLLKYNGVKDIYISSNDKRFDEFGVPRLEHENSYKYVNGRLQGYWLDAFYPFEDLNTQVTYIFGDVYFSEDAIKRIVEYKSNKNTLFGTGFARNSAHHPWGEPFAYKVFHYEEFKYGIEEVKALQDAGKTNRVPIVWELYRHLNGLNINVQAVKDSTYVCIDDGTADIDTPDRLQTLRESVEVGRRISVIIPVYNRKRLLQRAIKSIPKRIDTEIIVVDDGSTDGSTDDIIETDNLKVIKFSENRGVSAARNAGLDIARGKYILFLDSDDYVITENFYWMELFLNNTDIVYFNLVLNSGITYRLKQSSKRQWCGTTKFLRKGFIGNTRFREDVRVGEDLIFLDELLKKNPREVFSHTALIHYNHPRVEI